MTKKRTIAAIGYAILAAVFYALNMPLSKLLLGYVAPTFMASFLYLGAGFGIMAVSLLSREKQKENRLTKQDLPYTIGMIVLDIVAPILLMLGLTSTSSAGASLLNNFEIVVTSMIALVIFKEAISFWLWCGILFITVASILLSVEDMSSLAFSGGSLLILGATACWGLENNCTRQISNKSTYEIVMLKGIFSGVGAFAVASMMREPFPQMQYVGYAMLLGFVAYGLSIFFYIRAQKILGAAKTSAYYAVAPFIGALLSYILIREPLVRHYGIALFVMVAGSVIVVVDTLLVRHCHAHSHTITHTHNGSTHTHSIIHVHSHHHVLEKDGHTHIHLPAVYHGRT